MVKVRKNTVLSTEVMGPVLGVHTWTLNGWQFGWSKASLYLTRGNPEGELAVVAVVPCLKVAVAYSIGLHDGMELDAWGLESIERSKRAEG